ncbi:hypothetical protein HZQ57_18080 [Elizabethkingia anophelis]|nr:hypothetical protein [Elizabethkingia anophelis]MCT3814316.1 hypothetical protein [Elizabethkingia anophelis]MCT3821407.1 hypothetical protein [Elizabethkingia anophelis]
MAGGKITRIIGGKLTKEIEGDYNIWTDNFTMNSGGVGSFTSDKQIVFGTPLPPPPAGKYFVRGWWTDEDDKPIKEATVGDNVKFHLQMQNIPQNDTKRQVRMQLRDFEEFSLLYFIFGFKNDKFKGYDEITIKALDKDGNRYAKEYWDINSDQKIVIRLFLAESNLMKMISEESDRNLELYFRASYIDPDNSIEVLSFPEMESDYLKVNPPPIVEPIIFVHASGKHLLPAIYSANDGSPWYVGMVKNTVKNVMHAKKYNTLADLYLNGTKEELTQFEKQAYKMAVRKLEKGELIFNTGRKGTTSRFYDYDISDIDGKFKEKIKMGVNRGTGIEGETSRGINQLETQAGKGLSGVIKTVGEVVGAFGVLMDLGALLRGASDHNIPPPSIIPPFITMEVERMMAENDEFIIKHWNIELQKAIGQGKIATKRFLETNDINQGKNLRFKVIDLTEEGLAKILNKEISSVNNKEDSNSPMMIESLADIGNGNHDMGILVQSMEALDNYQRTTTNHYIHAIFVNELKA